jgi:predicted DNA-binding transcriptional regulator YafY
MAQRKPLKAEVRFHPDIAWMIPALLRSPDPLKTDSRGWGKLKMDVHAPERFFSWVLKFGDQAEIVSPASLRKALVKSLRAARARYRRRGRHK